MLWIVFYVEGFQLKVECVKFLCLLLGEVGYVGWWVMWVGELFKGVGGDLVDLGEGVESLLFFFTPWCCSCFCSDMMPLGMG